MMNRSKTPQEKKELSLKKDRRNVYGENDKSSRKNIPASKQRSHRAERRIPKEPLLALKGQVSEDAASAAESAVKDRIIAKKRVSFTKEPDAPLGVVLDRKRTRGWTRSKAAGSFGPS